MQNLPQNPRLTSFAISSWLRQLRGNVQASNVNDGGDLTVTRGPNGMTIKSKKNDGFYMRMMGTFEPSASYRQGDVVQVKDTVSYTVTTDTSSSIYYSYAGMYVCDSSVPMAVNVNDFNDAEAYVYNYIVSLNHRSSSVVYAPIYPEPEVLPSELSGSATQGRYWSLISLLPVTASMCVDGTPVTYYTHMAQSASVSGSV